jgi:hypothetical protein
MTPARPLIALAAAGALLLAAACKPAPKPEPGAKVAVRTEPPGAIVTINHKIKTTQPTPCVLPLKAGTHVLEINKAQFLPAWRSVTCKPGESLDLEVVLEPVSAAILVDSEPAGATIEIGGQEVGQTPFLLQNQPFGEHTAILRHPGHSPQQIAWTVADERPQSISATLASNVGRVRIESRPEGANVLIGGRPRGQTPLTVTLEQGEHAVRLEAPGHAPHEQNVVVLRDQTARVEAALQLLPGSLKVASVPPGAALHINGRQYENTPATIADLPPGSYEIRVEKPGFDDATRQVELAPGQEVEVTLQMDSNMGGLDLVVHPPGVTVYIDGRKLGVTQEGETPDLSAVFEVRGLTSGEHRVLLAHKRAKPNPEVAFTVRVEKGQIARPRAVRMWIADTYVKLANGLVLKGRIRQENQAEIFFEHNPSIVQRYGREEIESIRPLDPDE